MDTRELRKVDLNLLISLQYLLEEQSVSRAAERLYITQPAMSKTLSRLRALFGDALFTRSSHGMQPTPRALELAEGLSTVLGDITHLLAGSHFQPQTFQGEVTLALSEYIGVALLPGLIARLSTKAHRLSVRVITRVENQLEELALGNLDFAIHIEQAHYGNDYRVEHLGSSPPAILVRDSHPLSRGDLSMQRLAAQTAGAHEPWLKVCVKVAPPFFKRSRLGVFITLLFSEPILSKVWSSAKINRTFGLVDSCAYKHVVRINPNTPAIIFFTMFICSIYSTPFLFFSSIPDFWD